jgi:hypothetical protein
VYTIVRLIAAVAERNAERSAQRPNKLMVLVEIETPPGTIVARGRGGGWGSLTPLTRAAILSFRVLERAGLVG